MKSHLTDEELVSLILHNQQEAFRQIYNRYKSALLAFTIRRVPSDAAEDIVHDVFVKLWNNRSELVIEEKFVGYIFKSLRNRIIDYMAKEENATKYIESLSDYSETFTYSPTDELLRSKLYMDRINSLLIKYGPQYQLILKLRLEGYNNQEIADRLGVSEKTIRNQYWSLLKYLRSKLSNLLLFLFF